MAIDEICKALGSETRLRILEILANGGMSSVKVYHEYSKKFHDKKQRESIFRALQKLVNVNILEKVYDDKKKEIIYKLKAKEITIDLVNQRLKVVNNGTQ